MQQKLGVGGPLPETTKGRSVGQARKESTSQHPRDEGSQTSNYDFHQVKSSKGGPHTNEQYSSTDILTENCGTKSWKMNQIAQKIWQYLISKAITITAEYLSILQNVQD